MKKRDFTYEDFMRTYEELGKRKMEKIGPMDLMAFMRNLQRVHEYIEEWYDEPEDSTYYNAFTTAMVHVGRFQEEYNTERFGIAHQDGFMVSEGLLRTLHWYFLEHAEDKSLPGKDAVEEIKAWARNWMEENEGTW